ncbi:hypothetical protein FQN53_005429 [Emmonsiellopsis sp. PD_33]|nr:hypothetical protein FQN53_005429 [Emmonsiellopsis sp. PD_33]
MASEAPLHNWEVINLTNVPGNRDTNFTTSFCTLESPKFVSVGEGPETQKLRGNQGNPLLTIVNLEDKSTIQTRDHDFDRAIVHWTKPVVALLKHKSHQNDQGLVLGKRTEIKIVNPANGKTLATQTMDDVRLSKWVDENTLALVTGHAVFHWRLAQGQEPVRIFNIDEKLQVEQFINYLVNDSGDSMILVGLAQDRTANRIVGSMQLYSTAAQASYCVKGHAACFIQSRFVAIANREPNATIVSVREFWPQGSRPDALGNNIATIPAIDEVERRDFPIGVQLSKKYGILYVVTRVGYVYIRDLETANVLGRTKLEGSSIFATTPDSESTGFMAVNRSGQVLNVCINEQKFIPYLTSKGADPTLVMKLATRAGLPGADDLAKTQFDTLVNMNQFENAAKIAASSPRGVLRTVETMKFLMGKSSPHNDVIGYYFGTLLSGPGLNRDESIEFAKREVLKSGLGQLEEALKQGKLECSEDLGDLIRTRSVDLALSIYLKAQAHHKVVAGLAQTGQFDKILPYSRKYGYEPDYAQILMHIVRNNPDGGAEFATQLVNDPKGPLIDLDRVVDIFISQNLVQQATAFLLDALKDDKPEHANLQTRLLEMNLVNAPQVADAILGNDMFTQYDKARISQLCENAQLYQRALENTDDAAVIKRNIVRTDRLNPEWLMNYFGRLSVDQTLECMDEMLKVNIRQNLSAVVQIATKFSDLLGATNLINLLEKYRTAEGLYYYLGSIVNLSEDPDVHFKYIEAATKMNQMTEVERICRESNHYNPEKVKNFLKEASLTEQLPLIIVCDRFNFIHDLVLYLYQNQQYKSIEVYVQRVNPSRTPAVVGGLLDVDCDETIIKNLLSTVDAASIPIDDLVSEVETRNRLKILLPFLENTLASGNQQQAVYNALAKIYIDSNNNPEKFLTENDLYDTLTVGKYCEKRDPNLAYVAYRKGQNDLELISITNENSMYRPQARYLLERADPEIWSFVLNGNNIHRRSLVDQVIATAVPECSEPDKVSIAVKAFLDADLPGELIELLEKIILEPSPFSDNGSLQNLLMLTAAKADKGRLMDYIHQLTEFNADEIATMCVSVGLYEEAFEIYKKVDNHLAAVNVLVDSIVSIDRAQEYAERVELPEVWSKVAKAQLDGLRVSDSIASYIRAGDPSNYNEVIETASHAGKDEDLVEFLKMARKTLREPAVDTALAFSYARLNQLSELEDFLRGTNVADVEASGDRAYEEGFHEAAKIFFTSISNWAKLATTLVHLEEYQAAVECARKGNNVKVWKQVNEACVAKKEFRLAQICGLNLIVHAEELQDLVHQYERNGYFDELISVLEAGLGLERAHMGMFTELGIALSKYHPDRVMEHLKIFWTRINIPKMIRACEEANLWPELVFLYCHYDEWDNAALAMMERAAESWEHHSFKDIIVKVANLEIYYRALNFYLQEQPLLLTDLLQVLTPRIDVNRVVRMFEKSDNIPLIKPFLLNVQPQNKKTVNNAINDLLIEEEDYKTLRDSVENYDNYDPVDLAQRLEKHELIFFRQIAASIYRKNKRWEKSIALSKQDKLFKDAIETAAISGKTDVVEELLRYFVDIGSRECYVGMLYACYDLIRPDVVMEISWRYGLNDFSMPYMINLLSQQVRTVELLKKDNEERKAREASQQKEEDNTPVLGGSRLMLTQGPAQPPPTASPIPFGHTNGITPQPTGFRPF